MQVPPALQGKLEVVTPTRIAGWARDPAAPAAAVPLEILIDGVLLCPITAGDHRPDLAAAGIGTGHHAFSLTLADPFPPGHAAVVRVRHAIDGRDLPDSPRSIPPDPARPPALDEAIRRAAAANPSEAAALIATLAEHAASLLMMRGTAMPEPVRARLARFATTPLPPAAPDPRPLALFIDEHTPATRRDAGSNAALSHMRSLQRLGYRLHFAAAASMNRAGERTAGLEAMDITCWHLPWAGSIEDVLRSMGDRLSLVYVHRFGVMQRYGALIRRWAPAARLIYCVADLHHLRAARRVAIEAGLPAEAPEGRAATAGLRTAELLACLAADTVITHSSHEAMLLHAAIPEARVALVPWDIPPGPPVTGVPRHGVAFIGSYGHAPNLDAAHTLLEAVMPRVWATDPTIPLRLAGSDLPASLRDAAARIAGRPIEVLGWVEDLDAMMARIRLTVAPLRYGAGLKGKVLDSIAAGVPCICSPIAAEGMDLPAPLDTLIGNTPADMAALILRLHHDSAAYTALCDAGQAWIAGHFSAARIDAALRDAITP